MTTMIVELYITCIVFISSQPLLLKTMIRFNVTNK